jgi:ParB/RepB/Spo0J family partition protein
VPIEQIPLTQIDDNPYNPRKIYKAEKINEIAYSIQQFGQLETPMARRVGDRVQLAFGHVRFRAFKKLSRVEPEKFSTQPLNVMELTDSEMFYFAWEENMKRSDTTPIEQARAIDYFMNAFPDHTEAEVADKLKLKQPTVANMRRVLTLPEKVLNLIDEGTINFTMARELLVFSSFKNGPDLMNDVLDRVKTLDNPNRIYNSTVAGLQASIYETCWRRFKPLGQGQAWGVSREPLFDTADCMHCPNMVTAHKTAKEGSDWCADLVCWQDKQDAAKAKIAADEEAKQAAQEKPKQGVKPPVDVPYFPPEEESPKEPVEEGSIPGSTGSLYPDDWVRNHRKAGREAGIPQGIRMDIDVPDAECKGCALSTEDHTIGGKFSIGNFSYKVCVKDYRAAQKEAQKEAVENTGAPPAPNGHDDTVAPVSPGESVTVAEAPEPKALRAEGQAKKKAEAKAIKKAISAVGEYPSALNRLVLLTMVKKWYVTTKKTPTAWLWDKVSPGISEDKKTDPELFRLIFKLKSEELAELVAELMFYLLQYDGAVENYEIRTAAPLTWFDVDINKFLGPVEAQSNG